jgi:hypothetical protein
MRTEADLEGEVRSWRAALEDRAARPSCCWSTALQETGGADPPPTAASPSSRGVLYYVSLAARHSGDDY